MRLLLRIFVLGALAIVALILLAIRASRNSITLEQQETDAAIKLLLATGDDPQASAGLQQASAVSSATNTRPNSRPTTELTFNVAIVLVVSLLSVALLITGIIIVAVTLNPGGDSPSQHNYLTTQSSYDTDTEQIPRGRRQKQNNDYELFEDSGGEYGDLCVDGHEKQDNAYEWNAEAQVWSSTEMLMRSP